MLDDLQGTKLEPGEAALSVGLAWGTLEEMVLLCYRIANAPGIT